MKEAGLFILGTRESLNTGSEMLAGQVEHAGHFWGVGGGGGLLYLRRTGGAFYL